MTLRTGIVALEAPADPLAWRDRVRAVDDQGHDVLLMADHLGMWPPFTPLVAAAQASDRLRFGTQVLNIDFWNPVLLAREVAAADVLTGGRLEVGFGAGHAAVEYAAAGIGYDRPAVRIGRLAEAVPIVRRLLAGETIDHHGEHYRCERAEIGIAPTQQPVPVMIGGNGDRLLRLAAAEADIVGLTGFTAGTGRTHTDLSHFTWDGLADRIAHVRRHGGTGALSVLVQHVEITGDRRAAAAAFAQGQVDVDVVADSPFVLLGSEAGVAEQLARLQAAGVSYVTAFERSAAALARAVDRT
jgi:probable F420-dependent oxidoreductase